MSDLTVLERHAPPQVIHDAFRTDPATHRYTDAYQPHYPDADALLDGTHELHATEPVTAPEHILALRGRLAAIALGGAGCITLTNRCNEPVRAGDTSVSVSILADEAVANMQAVKDGMHDAGVSEEVIGKSVTAQRMGGQSAKPRSSETELLPDGRVVPSYMGDMINGQDPDDRTPDPSRMVAAAVQARDLRARLKEQTGKQVVMGSEALLLPYASSFIYTDPSGKKWNLAADTPWVGERTNKIPAGGEVNHHVELLSQVENPVGVKIGPKSDGNHIQWLRGKLNPNNEPGKLIFMLRMGDNKEAISRVLAGIKEHAPGAIIMYDIHGSTETDADGTKIRSVEKTVSDVALLDRMSREQGLRVRGLHIETIGNTAARQCVERRGQKPKDMPEVDPLFNTAQTRSIVGQTAMLLV